MKLKIKIILTSAKKFLSRNEKEGEKQKKKRNRMKMKKFILHKTSFKTLELGFKDINFAYVSLNSNRNPIELERAKSPEGNRNQFHLF